MASAANTRSQRTIAGFKGCLLMLAVVLGALYGSSAWLQWWISGARQDSEACEFIGLVDGTVEAKIVAAAKAEAEKWSEAELDVIRMPYNDMERLLPNLHVRSAWVYLEGRNLARVEFILGRSRRLVFSPKREFGYTEEICRKDNWVLFGSRRDD